MNKKIFLLCSSVLFTCIMGFNAPVIAQTTDNLFGYFGIKAGYSHIFSNKAKFSRENDPAAWPISLALPAQSRGTFVVGAAGGFGWKFLPFLGIRTELEYLYRLPVNNWESAKNLKPIDGDDYRSWHPKTQFHTLLVNAYLDWYVLPKLVVYAGFGVGASIMDITMKYEADQIGSRFSDGNSQRTTGNFAWQAGLGIGYNFNDHWGIDLNARYSDFGKVAWNKEEIKGTLQFSAVEALLTVSYRF